MIENKHRIFTIPNIITSLGLLSGGVAIIYAFDNPTNLKYAAYFIALAAVFDFLDGFFARLLNQQSPMGKELDSLADLVSFGVAPAVIIYQMVRKSIHVKAFSFDLPFLDILILLSPLLIVVFAALRLAKFNVDDRQSESFVGLPTPASALLLASLPLIKDFNPDDLIIIHDLFQISFNFYILMAIIGLQVFVMENYLFYMPFIFFVSIMMVVEMPLFSLKFKNLKWKNNRLRFIFLGLSVLILLLFQAYALPLVVLMYIFFSLLKIIKNSLQNRKAHKSIYENEKYAEL